MAPKDDDYRELEPIDGYEVKFTRAEDPESAPPFMYLDRQLMAPSGTAPRIEEYLRGRFGDFIEGGQGEFYDVIEVEGRGDQTIPELADEISAELGIEVTPNHVLLPAFHVGLGPHGLPRSTPPDLEPDDVPDLHEAYLGPTVVVIDTGVLEDSAFVAKSQVKQVGDALETTPHPPVPVPPFFGHGTAVASAVVRQRPNARIAMVKLPYATQASNPNNLLLGQVSDHALSQVLHNNMSLINRSQAVVLALGGPAHKGRLPATMDAIERVRSDTIIVAAAGNTRSRFDFWPASGNKVVGVGATDEMGFKACYSNYGTSADVWEMATNVEIDYYNKGNLTFQPPPAHDKVPNCDRHEVPTDSFTGTAIWSGTSIAAGIHAGKIVR